MAQGLKTIPSFVKTDLLSASFDKDQTGGEIKSAA
jgi:hypothetical protein